MIFKRILYSSIIFYLLCLNIMEANASGKIPIELDHYGKDSIGIRIAYELKEAIRRSHSYRLTNNDEFRFIISMYSAEEFPGTTNNASIYAVTILCYAKIEKMFVKVYLTQFIGACRDDDKVKEVAADIMAITDKIITKHTLK